MQYFGFKRRSEKRRFTQDNFIESLSLISGDSGLQRNNVLVFAANKANAESRASGGTWESDCSYSPSAVPSDVRLFMFFVPGFVSLLYHAVSMPPSRYEAIFFLHQSDQARGLPFDAQAMCGVICGRSSSAIFSATDCHLRIGSLESTSSCSGDQALSQGHSRGSRSFTVEPRTDVDQN